MSSGFVFLTKFVLQIGIRCYRLLARAQNNRKVIWIHSSICWCKSNAIRSFISGHHMNFFLISFSFFGQPWIKSPTLVLPKLTSFTSIWKHNRNYDLSFWYSANTSLMFNWLISLVPFCCQALQWTEQIYIMRQKIFISPGHDSKLVWIAVLINNDYYQRQSLGPERPESIQLLWLEYGRLLKIINLISNGRS